MQQPTTNSLNFTDRKIRIISIKDAPVFKERLLRYIERNWPGVKVCFKSQLDESLQTDGMLPNTFLMLRDDDIIGCYQLLAQEVIVRTDLSPWISCVFIDEKERGKRLSSQLLNHGRSEAGKLGYDKVYLTTDHIQLYEKFGFREIGLTNFTWGRPTKLYEHDTIR